MLRQSARGMLKWHPGHVRTKRPLSVVARIHGLLGCALVLVAAPAMGEPEAYPDGHGGEVMFPEGDISFADEVVDYDTGNKEPIASARDPEAALGAPDYNENKDANFATLGCNGALVLKFTDNVVIDVPGPDLYVFEIGPDIEPTALAISNDGDAWTRVGRIDGGKAEIDIAPYVRGEKEFRYVRLVDLGAKCKSRTPGSDIDAVGAIGSAERIALDSSVLFGTGEHQLEPAASDAIESAIAGIDRDGLQSVVVAGHTDAVGSAEANQTLSQSRADTVVQYLSEQAGFDADLLTAEAWGQTRPIASNETTKGRAQNRRVEITLRRSASGKGDETEQVEILGLWQAQKQGIVELSRAAEGTVSGTYRHDEGRIRGAFTSDTVFEGYWIKDKSGQRCESEKYGSSYWGRLRLEFSSAALNEYEGQWGYCDAEDWPGEWSPGERIL